MNGWNWQLKTVFLHDITIILFTLMIFFTELVLYPFYVGRWCWVAYSAVAGVLLLWHMVGQGPAALATGAGRIGFFFSSFFFLISSILSSFSNASYLGRRLDILKYCGVGRYNPAIVVSYYWRRAGLVLVNRLVCRSLSRNSVNG